MEQVGRVVKTEGRMAEIQIQRTTACSGDCGKCSGCAPTSLTVKASNEVNAKVGQMVKIDTSTSNVLLAAFGVYIVPIVLLIATYMTVYGYITLNSLPIDAEFMGIIAGLIVLVISFIIIRFIDKKLAKSNKFELKIKKIIH
ncbi:MAG: sigma-E factor negative regulatory protein RseC [Petroclostridium sp.]|jgi:sigma-E factor negative regulatory protein RseC|nr:positive regulator of sigma RseC/MucC [Clostridia bacterium]MDK2809454.1 sigma-E factor negative regulatory protein RseC [Petroclostridium sp.]